MNKLLKQIKENNELRKKIALFFYNANYPNAYKKEEVEKYEKDVDYFMSLFSQSRIKELEVLVEEIRAIREAVREATGSFKYDSCYDDIIILIQKTILDL